MSKKEVDQSKLHLTIAKPAKQPRKKPIEFSGETPFVEAVPAKPIEFMYAERGVLTEDPAKALAKKSVESGRTRWFVKFAKSSGQAGHMLNPWGLYFNPGDENLIEKNTGKPRYAFKEVPEHVFDLYLRFLETRNQVHLSSAERAYI